MVEEMVIFGTASGAVYEWHGNLLTRALDGVLQGRTDINDVARVAVGQRAVLMTHDGTVSLTDRVVRVIVGDALAQAV